MQILFKKAENKNPFIAPHLMLFMIAVDIWEI